MEENLPPGFRFHPTDEELVTYYLRRKVTEFGFAARAIADVDINKCEPWDLPGKASMGEKEWYFFSLKDRKYPTGMRTNRATESGYWKTTGKDKEIFHCGLLAGMKKTLVFYKGRAPRGEKTSWVMHEYRLHSKCPYKSTKEEWVVCRVFKKNNTFKKQEPNTIVPLPHLLESPCNAEFSDLGEFDASILNSPINNPSSHYHGMQTNENNNSSSSCNNNNKMNMNTYMNWILASESTIQPSAPWLAGIGSGCLQGAETLRALSLSLNAHHARESMGGSSSSPFVGHVDTLFGMDSKSSFAAAISKGAESAQQRSFDQGPVWGNY